MTFNLLPDIFIRKQQVDSLEGQTLSLWVEEVDRREESGVDDGEDDVKLVADILDSDGGDLDDGVVGDPITGGGDCRSLLSKSEWEDLGWIDPYDRLETNL